MHALQARIHPLHKLHQQKHIVPPCYPTVDLLEHGSRERVKPVSVTAEKDRFERVAAVAEGTVGM
jgi:hypothetical protein